MKTLQVSSVSRDFHKPGVAFLRLVEQPTACEGRTAFLLRQALTWAKARAGEAIRWRIIMIQYIYRGERCSRSRSSIRTSHDLI